MSYEGFNQRLCAVGHLREYDAHNDPVDDASWCSDKSNPCPGCSCGQPFIFAWRVDCTNGIFGSDPTTMRYPFKVRTPATYDICNLGHKHMREETCYLIPAGKEV